MTASAEHTTEMVSGREHPLTVRRQTGRQEIQAGGQPLQIEDLTVFESPLGTSRCYTRERPAAADRAAGRQLIQEIAVKAMVDQGIW